MNKMIHQIFKHLLKKNTNNDFSIYANYVNKACIEGNTEMFMQYFNHDNQYINFANCAMHSASNGHIEIYKTLMNDEKVYKTRKIRLSIPMHYSASLRNGYQELTEYMLSDQFAYKIDVNATKLSTIKEVAQEYNNPAVMSNFYYLLTVQDYQPSEEVKQWLEKYKPEMLVAINNRNTYNNLRLLNKTTIQRNIRKI